MFGEVPHRRYGCMSEDIRGPYDDVRYTVAEVSARNGYLHESSHVFLGLATSYWPGRSARDEQTRG